MKPAVVALDQDAIGEFQRTVDRKQNLARRAELDDGVLKKDTLVCVSGDAAAVSAAAAIGAAESDGNPHWRGIGKEPSQAAYDIWFKSASSCLVGHGKPQSRGTWSRRASPLPGLEELQGDSFCLIAIP